VQPIPSLAVARFEVDPERGRLTSGYAVPRGTGLFAHPERGDICRFRTCYPLTLWPVELTEAAFELPDRYPFLDQEGEVASVLRLRLAARGEPFEALELDRLRFHLAGDPMLVGRIWELLVSRTLRVELLAAGDKHPRRLAGEPIQPVGFGLDEAVLPYPAHAQPAYRLLQEYFAFPDKFLFFDLVGLAGQASGGSLDVLFLLGEAPASRLPNGPENFVLGCTPIINLFAKTTEPIRIDHRRLEYRLVADERREKTTEIHSILAVSGSSDAAERSRDFAPFYAFTHEMGERGQKVFWHARRVPSLYREVAGTEMLLSFLDLDFKPTQPPLEAVFAHTLCTNRALAAQLPAAALLATDEPLPVARLVCGKKPTPQASPPLAGQTLWRLISHLSLNYLSLSGERESVAALREILRLYCASEAASVHQQISGIRSMAVRPVVRRLGESAWRGFCKGHEVTLTLDEGRFVGGSAFLLGAVLHHFFALYASTNSFTQLVVRRFEREGEWKRWPPMAGARRLQ
jgi:type VI secretion system protein ImpG